MQRLKINEQSLEDLRILVAEDEYLLAAELSSTLRGAGATIDKHAKTVGADLIVMGAFGRSRLREFVLGGVTRSLTQSSSKPLLLAH